MVNFYTKKMIRFDDGSTLLRKNIAYKNNSETIKNVFILCVNCLSNLKMEEILKKLI